MTECAQSNISEIPHTVPPLSGDIVASSRNLPETLTSEDPNAAQTEKSDAWISMKVSVIINLVELCLYAGTARDAPLAAVQVRFPCTIHFNCHIYLGVYSILMSLGPVIADRFWG